MRFEVSGPGNMETMIGEYKAKVIHTNKIGIVVVYFQTLKRKSAAIYLLTNVDLFLRDLADKISDGFRLAR